MDNQGQTYQGPYKTRIGKKVRTCLQEIQLKSIKDHSFSNKRNLESVKDFKTK